jgi:hypothetical protein
MSAWLLLCVALAADPSTEPVVDDSAPDAVIICPKAFVPALEPLLAHRHAQGHRFAHIPNTWKAEEIKAGIRKAAERGKLKYVLLVGDAEPAMNTNVLVRQRCIPAYYETAKVNVKFGSEPEIATDNWYADLDEDSIPDLAIGRIPADTPKQVSDVVAKIIAYEKSLDHGLWRQRINFVAGVGGFGGVVDSVIESTTRKFLTDGIPAGYTTNMTYGSWRSPFCPDPRRFHEVALQQHNDGCLFWVYLGHGQLNSLDRVVVPGARFHIMDVNDGHKLKNQNRSPIAIMLACYTAAFDAEEDCLAETMIHSPGGPVAVYGGSRVTMPYAMAVMGTSMMQEYFQDRPETLGLTILGAKKRMMAPIDESNALKNANRLLLDGIASVMSPTREHLVDERREHLYLFNLIGDPMTKLAHPAPVKLNVPRDAEPGQQIEVSGETAVAGKAWLEICCRRDKFKSELPQRDHFDPSNAGLASLQPIYEQANDRNWARFELKLPAGAFTTKVTVPADCSGSCHVRVFVQGEATHALGSANIYVRPVKLTNHIESK